MPEASRSSTAVPDFVLEGEETVLLVPVELPEPVGLPEPVVWLTLLAWEEVELPVLLGVLLGVLELLAVGATAFPSAICWNRENVLPVVGALIAATIPL